MWYSMLNPPNKYLAIGQDNNRLEFNKEELESCKLLLGLRYCAFPTLYFGTHESCLYSYYTDKKTLDSCKVDLAKEYIYAKQVANSHWLFVDTTAEMVRVKCLDNNGSATQELKNGKAMLTLNPGCTAQSERIKVESSFDAFDIDVNVPTPFIPTNEMIANIEHILHRVGVEDVESIVKQLDVMKDKFTSPEFAKIDLDGLKLQAIHASHADRNLIIVGCLTIALCVIIAIVQCIFKKIRGYYCCCGSPQCCTQHGPEDPILRANRMTGSVNVREAIVMTDLLKADKDAEDAQNAENNNTFRKVFRRRNVTRQEPVQIINHPPSVNSVSAISDTTNTTVSNIRSRYEPDIVARTAMIHYDENAAKLDAIAQKRSLMRTATAPPPPPMPAPRFHSDPESSTYKPATDTHYANRYMCPPANEVQRKELEDIQRRFPGIDFGLPENHQRRSYSIPKQDFSSLD